ncbi:ATPase [Opitutaceae bacterium EW11]|nr:ATPase [Opitutaceae bacterium EW11]
MQTQNHYTTSFLVEQSPQEVFKSINQVRGWWSGEIAGSADRLGAEFTYRVPNMHYSRQKVTEWVPGERIVWHVQDAELTFVKDKREWKGTDIVFEIAKKDRKTEVRFTHRGLVPAFECYDKCSDAWGALVKGNLRQWIVTGQVQPSPWGEHPERPTARPAEQAARQE